MKIGIMQPYFFPYIGYFQLIGAVDTYVNLDHVNYMKRSYMTRNTIKDNIVINIPVNNGSQNNSCREVFVPYKSVNDLVFKLNHYYRKSPYWNDVFETVLEKMPVDVSISEFNIMNIKNICKYLDIKTTIIDSSVGLTTSKREAGLKEITKHFCGTTYINAIGGQELYSKDDFSKDGIELKFLKCNSVYKTSILDLLFLYSKEYIQNEINSKYELI